MSLSHPLVIRMSRRRQRPRTERSERLFRLLACLIVFGSLLAVGCGGKGNTVDSGRVVRTGGQLFVTEGCVNCHGEMGQGVTAPPLWGGRVIETFPDCAEQIRWETLGSARWQRDVAPSYGAQPKLVNGGMPGFGDRLDEEQLESVVTFTRVEFGGLDATEAARDCFE